MSSFVTVSCYHDHSSSQFKSARYFIVMSRQCSLLKCNFYQIFSFHIKSIKLIILVCFSPGNLWFRTCTESGKCLNSISFNENSPFWFKSSSSSLVLSNFIIKRRAMKRLNFSCNRVNHWRSLWHNGNRCMKWTWWPVFIHWTKFFSLSIAHSLRWENI